jgi:glycosyltransferase involved in cell wall biosynthesis
MRALDIVVHASTEPEPFGLVIAEAMASGRAVVLAAAGGALELATPGVSAETHAPGDEAGLAARLHSLIDDRSRRETMGRSGRAEAEAKFSRARMATETAAVYASLGIAAAAPTDG